MGSGILKLSSPLPLPIHQSDNNNNNSDNDTTAIITAATKKQTETQETRKLKVIEGIDLLLHLFEEAGQQRLFPRKIMTAKYSGQFTAYSKEQMIKLFEEADFVDCRINAYPVVADCVLQIPNLLVIDLDLNKALKTGFKLVKQSLNKTLQNISECFDDAVIPLVLWTGNGYHIYVVLNMKEPLENIEEYASLGLIKEKEISREFILFGKTFLSDNKADAKNNPSFESCLLRVPYTLNSKCLNAGKSKQESEVKIIQSWNNHAANMNEIALLLSGFYTYLVSEKIFKNKVAYLNEAKRRRKYEVQRTTSTGSIPWIETLLQIAITDHRKYVMSIILAPYFKNIQNLSDKDAFDKIKEWLSKCDKVEKLDLTYNFDHWIRYYINRCMANRKLKPIRFECKLSNSNPGLYRIIKSKL